MDAAIIESIKEKVSDIKDSLTDRLQKLFEENKKLFLMLLGLVFVILLCLVLLIYASLSNADKKKKEASKIPEPLSMGVEVPVIPDGPKLPKDYNISRKAKEKWSQEDASQYFTLPSQKEIDSLSFSNDKIVNDILEAAP